MCSGKSTLGQALAQNLGIDFIDLDEAIESAAGMSVSRIFSEYGEPRFRQIESDLLSETIRSLEGKNAVVALGGGTPCQPGVMETLNRAGLTVHLTAPVDRIVERLLEGDPNRRPLIAGKNEDELKDYVERMLRERHPFYSQAVATFDASRLEDEQQICESVNRFKKDILHL